MKNYNYIREMVKQKARELFLKYGPGNVSMEDIAERTLISKKTIYLLFRNKQELVQEVVDDLVQSHNGLFESSRRDSRDAIDEVLKQENGLSTICRSVRPSFFDDLEKYFPGTWNKLKQYEVKVQRSIEENLQRGIAEGLYMDNLNHTLISDIRLQQVVYILRPEALTNISLNVRELIDEFTLFYLRAISTEKGREILQKYIDEKN